MSRGLVAAAGCLMLAGCASRAKAPASPDLAPAALRDARAAACGASGGEAVAAQTEAPLVVDGLPDGAAVAGVRTEGSTHVPGEWILQDFAIHPGDALDAAGVDAAIARVFGLGAFEDVRVEAQDTGAGRVALVVRVVERPLVRRVFFADGAAEPTQAEWTAPQGGDIYDPVAVASAAADLERTWRAMGFLDATAEVGARRVGEDRVDLCVHTAKGDSWRIDRIDFPGASVAPAAELRAALVGERDIANGPGLPWREDLAGERMVFVEAKLYDRGLLTSKVRRPRVMRAARDHTLRVEIPIEEGKVYRLRRIDAHGLLAGPAAAYVAALGVASGEVFSRVRLVEGLERVRKKHVALGGRATDSVEPQTELDAEAGVVDLTLDVEKAP